jgi:hypothetical protein
MAGETVITDNKAVHKDAPKSTARGLADELKGSGVFFCLSYLSIAAHFPWNYCPVTAAVALSVNS